MIERNVKTTEELQSEWKNPYLQWWAAGMPAFHVVSNDPAMQVRFKFKTREGREAFAELLGQSLTDKTNVVSYPEKPREPNMQSRFIED